MGVEFFIDSNGPCERFSGALLGMEPNDVAALNVFRHRWVLRVLAQPRIAGRLCHDYQWEGEADAELAQVLALKEPQNRPIGIRALQKTVKARLANQKKLSLSRNTTPWRNLKKLGSILGFDDSEAELLLFLTLLTGDRLLQSVVDLLGKPSVPQIAASLSLVLGQPVQRIKRAISSEGVLRSSGLLTWNAQSDSCDAFRLEPMDGLLESLFKEVDSPLELFRKHLTPISVATLNPKDYLHLRESFLLVQRVLDSALRDRVSGVNVLLYGPPGSGKTELARTFTKTLAADGYEIALETEEEMPGERRSRLSAYKLGQLLLRHSPRSLIIFDEIEDAFTKSYDDRAQYKGWLNRTLESNPVPAIWIANDLEDIDPAQLRRFECVLEVAHPPRSVRRKMLKTALAAIPVQDRWLDRMASLNQLSPGLVALTTRGMVRAGVTEAREAETTLEHMLGQSLKAMGHAWRAGELCLPDYYDPGLLACDHDPQFIAKTLQKDPQLRACLSGPSGTGKTAFGYWLAQTIDRPLLRKTAGDLLGPFVGMTERNISQMFEEAERERAVLLLDEAEGLLRSREAANAQWEVTLVNQLLSDMEKFDGIFLCATNHFDMLDDASLRRFDLKIQFSPLGSEAAWTLFISVLRKLGGKVPRGKMADSLRKGISIMGNLTPGDFAQVERRARFDRDAANPERLFGALQDESRIKSGSSRPIGFNANL